jgi:hypothetical protein
VNVVLSLRLADLGSGAYRDTGEAVADVLEALAAMGKIEARDVSVFDKFEQVYSGFSYKEGDYLPANHERRAVLRFRFETTFKNC